MTSDGSIIDCARVERHSRFTCADSDFAVCKKFSAHRYDGRSWVRLRRDAALLLYLMFTILGVDSAWAVDTRPTGASPDQPVDIGALPPGTPRTVAEHNNHAIALAIKGDLIGAIAELSLALKLAPQDSIALYNRGNFYFRLGDIDRAIADFTEVIRVKPNFALALMNRGTAYSNQGRLDEALADLNAAEQLRVDNFLIFYNRAVVHGRRREFDLAIADFDSTLRLKPNDVRTLVARGLVFETIEKFDRALQDYRSALDADPNDKPAEAAVQRLTSRISNLNKP